ncbi:hypothetical protein [Streptobacillus moniliformis]|uniref:Outer membrane protein beta-barrel domain-containing protein n=2 Tax=Streptobacillus moniliformis TaxID=34105 RepID=D1AX67_STRM9|nr:hypothetical protein [Streptobacillus moniliformis]ACZ00893.1 hypothetical protein Smon_0411 [Streptobacillus moniliformis DSM 12112]AVL42720.1 hypothetical protein CEP89_02145 [Streptobacillus moniliformis]QXW65700.1 hypothetical protein KX935_08100 [Streptobacillus moniliformis]SQA13969.1 Uncharacterised protein [Streptobacillus moniliformis]
MKKMLLIILFVGIGLISFSNNIIGPRYRVDLSLGFGYILSEKDNGNEFISTSIGVLPEWKYQINNKLDLTFGPKVNLIFSNYISSKTKFLNGLVLGGEGDFNYRLKENVRLYSGIEVGIGGLIKFMPNKVESYEIINVSKISLGAKIKDKFNIAFYIGYSKGLLGIETGYTF